MLGMYLNLWLIILILLSIFLSPYLSSSYKKCKGSKIPNFFLLIIFLSYKISQISSLILSKFSRSSVLLKYTNIFDT